MITDILESMGGEYADAARSIIDKKYKIAKLKSHLRLCRMKSGKFRIMDYNEKNYGTLNDVDKAKKKFVELYESTYGVIKLQRK